MTPGCPNCRSKSSRLSRAHLAGSAAILTVAVGLCIISLPVGGIAGAAAGGHALFTPRKCKQCGHEWIHKPRFLQRKQKTSKVEAPEEEYRHDYVEIPDSESPKIGEF
mmetsp:Transcript_23819/g.32503  ORF Transcript_23819/g.32503 Transcript_23819/m.32503 type:complete len:108 (-) Transcript_23819:86-409(-)|eukprot:CAMPEP_0201492950 /NCGR_PEP_ID=MMETSP0151_2-20130828/35482_1 /ASSEMBLY_ACC=CAM_ASM_000257 /TAXON_ID=200890 /ORGANISM="Paramoeba atlantica, Strain 621/1 / CCAP 1560/9" /LENGTH=107 /DNA_ID=CAMNT_0047880053 /DNA_START=56 /DNA_END=379 /DNA_ORIENTATION=+